MGESKDVNDVDEKEESLDYMAFICVDSVSEKKQRKWDLKNIHREDKVTC